MNALVQDVRYGIRMLAKSPGFTAVAVLTLALGIGANTAMFSVVNGVLLRPLPYPQADQIVQILPTYRGQPQIDNSSFSSLQFTYWRSHDEPFQYLAASTPVGFNLAGASQPERVRALRVSAEYFHVLGVRPVLGRDFLPDEDRIGGPNVAILSEGLWKRDFGADPQVNGRSILLDGASYTVVGVMPGDLESISPVGLWTTIGQVAQTIGSGSNYEVIGRLKPSISRRQADSFLGTLTKPYLAQFFPRAPENVTRDVSFGAFPYQSVITGEDREPLLLLFGAVGFVLLIACVNVANLQVARAATRNREIAVRTALGAGRRRIVRQLLTENVLLAVAGAAVGLLLAYWSLGFLVALAPAGLPRAREISLDRWALAFTGFVAVLAGILFGLGPAFQASRTDLNEFVKETGGRSSTRRQRVGTVLSAGEVALSLVLLIGSGLLIETFANLIRTNPGFDPRHILSLQIWTTGSNYKSGGDLANLYESIVRRIESIRGVESATVVAAGSPLERGGNLPVRVEGRKGSEWFSADYREITPEYFHTLGITLLRGRLFAPADSQNANKVAIINAALARKLFPGRNPIGERLALAHEGRPEIVGVVGDVKSSLDAPAEPSTFIPMAQADYRVDQLFQGWFPTCVLVRTATKPSSVSHAVEDALRDADPNLPIGEVRSMEEVLSVSIAKQRFRMTLMAVFAGLALALAAAGIYGVISYSVSQRTHEIGVRMALGATRGIVLKMIVRQGLRLTLSGTAIGLLGALGLTRVLKSMLFGVKPTDPITFVAVSILLAAVALLACYIPARRATKVDPMEALRYE